MPDMGVNDDLSAAPPAPRADVALSIRGFSLWYGATQALHEISLDVPRGKITALIGPSGCGKSTLIRSVNRLNDLVDGVRVEGDMLLDGESIYAKTVDVIELRKRTGMVFQRTNPFPMSIYENVVYPLRIDGENRRGVLDETVERALRNAALWDEVKDRLKGKRPAEIVEKALRQSALWDEVKDMLDKPGTSLSGGQQQRLCIARTLAVEPDVVLMDEPCSALDPIATARIEDLLHALRSDYTIVIVTHNLQQATRVSDWTGFFLTGELVEYAPTDKMFTSPADRRTEDYITGKFG